MNKLYKEEMLQVVIEVRDKYLQDYLEVVEINFKYDFLQYIEECKYLDRVFFKWCKILFDFLF